MCKTGIVEMNPGHRDYVIERVFVIKFENIEEARLLEHFESFHKFCLSHGLKYQKKAQWHVDIDSTQEIPKIKDGSRQDIEHHFCDVAPGQKEVKYSIFRIVSGGVIFNALRSNISEYNSLEHMKKKFNPIWSEFLNNTDLPEECEISLCYAIDLNKNTLDKDNSLFRPGWLEVKEISSLFGCIRDFDFKNQYEHPFSCSQNWSTVDDNLGKVFLSCKASSYISESDVSLRFLLEVRSKAQTQNICTFDWNYLFDYLSKLRAVVLMGKAQRATAEEWK